MSRFTRPDLIKHDLGKFQRTRTQEFLNSSWVLGVGSRSHMAHVIVTKLVHYRLVFDVAGYTLAQFSGTHELFGAPFDVLNSMFLAPQFMTMTHCRF